MVDTRVEAKELADLLWEDIKTLPKKERAKADAIIRLYCNESVTTIRKIMKQEVGKKLDNLNTKIDVQGRDIKTIKGKVGGMNGDS